MAESLVETAKARFLAGIERMPENAVLSEREQDILASMLQSKVFRKAAALVYREIQSAGTQILAFNLADEAHRHSASKLQGKAVGMIRAFEGLFELLDGDRFTTEREEE